MMSFSLPWYAIGSGQAVAACGRQAARAGRQASGRLRGRQWQVSQSGVPGR
jgi:hypothetical protein